MAHDDVTSSPSLLPDRQVPAEDAAQIWRAGVAAVDSCDLVTRAVHRIGSSLTVCAETFDLPSISRLVVVGAGKASGGMARGLEHALGPDLVEQKVSGWINVPDDCVATLRRIHLHGARPAGINEPTEAGVFGSQQILNLVQGLTNSDVCLVLLSGGGSALLPLPTPGISLVDKQVMTRTLSRHGATIHELNSVRKRLSLIKGGGLVRAAAAGRMIALIISDVIGDPLDIIASGPTVRDSGTADDALAVLERIRQMDPLADLPISIWDELRRQSTEKTPPIDHGVRCQNFVIGNNATAVAAAHQCAIDLGYDVQVLGSDRHGFARDIGVELAEQCLAIRSSTTKPVCLIGGGEPVVQLAPTTRPRKGGRNQEVVLAALCRLWNDQMEGIAILSGGTDGEDGPTDAAGAICSGAIRVIAANQGLNPFDALSINDSYTFFAGCHGLLQTGPTQTNVMDLQVAIIRPLELLP